MEDAIATDTRLAPFEGDRTLLVTGQSLLEYIDRIQEFNSLYLTEDDDVSEYGTLWKQIRYTKSIADEPTEDMDPEKVKAAQKLVKTIDDVTAKLSLARKAAAEWAASELGISVANEKIEVPKEELDAMKKSVREPAVSLANMFVVMAQSIARMDKEKSDVIVDWLSQYPIPQLGRKGKLDVTEVKEQAKRHRVDITATDANGNVLWENVAGFTKAAAQKATPTADEFRKVFEGNGEKQTTFRDGNDVTYVITPRTTS